MRLLKKFMDDKETIRQAKKGDKDAYRVLVEAYQDRVFTLVRSLVSQAQQAEDLTQEIFVKAYFALPSFKGDSAFYTWLFRIASNHCIDSLRSRRLPEISLDETIDEDGDRSRGQTFRAPSSEEPEAALQKEGDITRLLNCLKAEERVVLSLREVQGHSYDEMAVLLNCPANTIKSRLNRARSALRDAYMAEYGNISMQEYVKKSEEIRP